MTQNEFTDAFQKFMPKKRADALADALCQAPALTIIDDDNGMDGYDDGSICDDDGVYLRETRISDDERKKNRALNGQACLIKLPADMLYSTWMSEMVNKLMPPERGRALYAMPLDGDKTRCCGEIAVAICAIRKAFPNDAARLVKKYVKENPTYALFWDSAVDMIHDLVPAGA